MKRIWKILCIVLIVILLILVFGFLYLYTHGLSGMDHLSKAKEGQIKVACIGDSTTYGHGISGWPKNNYPSTLQELLGEAYHVNNYAFSGYAVQVDADRSYRTLGIYEESMEYDADIVVFMMGTNDTKAHNWKGAEQFKTDLLSLLDTYGDAEIYLCTTPAAFFLDGQTEGATNYKIQPLVVDELAEVIRQIADEKDYTLVDIHALTTDHPEWFIDGVHPIKDGAAAIAQAIAETIIS